MISCNIAEDFRNTFNNKLDVSELKIGEFSTETGDGEDYYQYNYPESGFSVSFVSESKNGNVKAVVEMMTMKEGTDSALGGQLISKLILATNQTLDSKSGMKILTELGLDQMDQWDVGYSAETSYDELYYTVTFDESYLLTLLITPMSTE